MILTTTNSIEEHPIQDYLGIVTGLSMNYQKGKFTFNMAKYYEAIESEVGKLKEEAFQKLQENAVKLKANAVVGIKIDFEVLPTTAVNMISVVGTAVKVD